MAKRVLEQTRGGAVIVFDETDEQRDARRTREGEDARRQFVPLTAGQRSVLVRVISRARHEVNHKRG